MAYSQGFSPHPKISWIGAAPTGTASEAEYVEIGMVEHRDPEVVAAQLNAALPAGIEVLDAVLAEGGGFADRMEACRWRIELDHVDPSTLRAAVDRLDAAEVVEVQRRTKSGLRDMDVKPALVSVTVSNASLTGSAQVGAHPSGQDSAEVTSPARVCGILEVVVRQLTPVVRPDDVLSALRVVADLQPPVPAKATRLAQGRLDDKGDLTDPLAQDRAVGSGGDSGEAVALPTRR
jgi:radical SAM-linked protein